MSWWQRLFTRKESQARIVATLNQVGRPAQTPANYENFARQGFLKNVIVFRSIDMIAKAAGGIGWTLYSGRKSNASEIEDHELLKLLERPNPLQAGATFIEAVVAYHRLTGNAYIEANQPSPNKPPKELWAPRPDWMKVIPGNLGYPAFYEFGNGLNKRRWAVDPVTLRSSIMHWKAFHPIDPWYGMSPLEAAMMSVDQNNAGQRWNLAMLQNSATPSGVLQMKQTDSNPRGELTDEQYKRLKVEFEGNYQGARNAGRPLIIEGGLAWQQISLSPKDMDFINSKAVTAIDIATAYGVPPELLGLGQKTFNNYKEARLALYEETILPIMDSLRDELNKWLLPAFGDGLWLDYDRDDIEALTEKREQKFAMIKDITFLTQNEKRQAVGYDKQEGWDVYLINGQLVASPEDLTTTPDPGTNSDDADPDAEGEDQESDPDEQEAEEETPAPKTPEDESESDDAKGWKSINLVNRNEKRQAWRQQNARRAKLSQSFQKDVHANLKTLAGKIASAVGPLKDSKLAEFAALKAAGDFMPTLQKTVALHIQRTAEDFGHMILEEAKSKNLGGEVKASRRFDDFIKRYTETRSGEAIKTINSTTAKNIRRVIGEWVQSTVEGGDSNVELSKYIEMEFEELSSSQSTRIARTEVALASNNGAREAVKSLQLPNIKKEWVTAQDDRVRDGGEGHGPDHAAMDGVQVGLDEKFIVPPDTSMDGPGDPSAGADQVINCRCVLTFSSKN